MEFGRPLRADPFSGEPARAQQALQSALAQTMDQLASKSIAQTQEGFDEVVGGASGTGFAYDAWQHFKAFCRGQRYDREHASVVTTADKKASTR